MADQIPGLKTALITGGSRGLGEALCRLYLEKGFAVVSVSRNPSGVRGVENCLADLSSPRETASCAERIREGHGRLDLLINNAGVSPAALIMNADEKDYERTVQVNFNAARALTESLRGLLHGGCVVNIASRTGVEGRAGLCAYAASKGLLIGYTAGLAREMRAEGIRVFAVNPGFMKTGMALPKIVEKQTRESLLNAVSTPEASARFVYWVSCLRGGSGRLFDFDSRIYKSWTNLS